MILDESDIKMKQIQADERRMSRMSHPGSGKSVRSSKYSKRLGNSEDDSDEGIS